MQGIEAQAGDILGRVVRGRRIILAGEVAAGTTGRVTELRGLGAVRFLVIASGRGTGPLPEGDDVELFVADEGPAPDLVSGFRRQERLLANPSAALVEAIARFDPDREALVLAAPFLAVFSVAGRPVYGGRRPEWVRLEDKAVTDDVLVGAGVAVPDHEIVPAAADDLERASARLDRGDGTVWAGDARDGFNGGAVFVRWVRDCDDRAEALEFFTRRCARVRVAPFVEGIPCSIHGFVTDACVAAFRPVELVTLRSPRIPQLRYAGAATYWDPPPEDRDVMRDAARRVGAELRRRAAFRGAFTVDGILSADGWVATECNPRFGAGLGYTATVCPRLRLGLLQHAIVAGDGEALDAGALERTVVAAADATRWGGTWTASTHPVQVVGPLPLTGDETRYRRCAPGEPADVTLECGKGPTGGFVRGVFVRERTPVGESVARRAAAVLAFADEYVGSGFGPLSAPRSVR